MTPDLPEPETEDNPVANASRYDKAAESYNEGRLNYSQALIKRAVLSAGVGPKSTVLDLGCGPGTIANEIAKYCGKVIAIDPSAEMIEQGRKNAPDNVTYIQGSSDDLSFITEPVQLVTFGRSFHWMNRVETLRQLNKLVAKDGALAFLYVSPLAGKTKRHRWFYAVRSAVREASDLSETKDEGLPQNSEREEFVLLRSAFSEVNAYSRYETFEWEFGRIVAWVMSRYATTAGETSEHLAEGDATDSNAPPAQNDLQARRAEIEDVVRTALEPYNDVPWNTYNQQRVIIARRKRKPVRTGPLWFARRVKAKLKRMLRGE